MLSAICKFSILLLSVCLFSIEQLAAQCANTYNISNGKIVLVWTSSVQPTGITSISFDGFSFSGTATGKYQWQSDAAPFATGTHDKGSHTIISNGETCPYNNGVLPTDETRKLQEQLEKIKKEAEEKTRLAEEAEQAKKDIYQKKREQTAEEKAKMAAEEKAKLDEYELSKRKAQLEAEEKRMKEEEEKNALKSAVDAERAKALEEKERLMAEEERLKKQSEETLKLLAEIEKFKRQTEEKTKIIESVEQIKKDKEEKDKLAAARALQEAEEKAKRDAILSEQKSKTAEAIKNLETKITLSKEDADRMRREANAKQAEKKSKTDDAERFKKETEEKTRMEADAKAKADSEAAKKKLDLNYTEAPSITSADCESEGFLDNCQRLVIGSIVETYNLSADAKGQQDYSVVLSKDNEYSLTVCSGRNGRMIASIYDRDNTKILGSSFNRTKKLYYSRFNFTCPASGVYHIRFSFESEIGCGVSILSNKK